MEVVIEIQILRTSGIPSGSFPSQESSDPGCDELPSFLSIPTSSFNHSSSVFDSTCLRSVVRGTPELLNWAGGLMHVAPRVMPCKAWFARRIRLASWWEKKQGEVSN